MTLQILAAIAPLPTPSPFARYLLEQPLPVALGLLGAAIVVRIALARQGSDRKSRIVGGVLVAAALFVYVTGEVIHTDREQLRAASRSLITAAATAAKLPQLETHLAPEVTISVGSFESTTFPLDDVVTLVQLLQDRVPIRDVSIGELQAHVPQVDRAVIQVWARVDPRDWYPTPTVWRIEWRRDGKGQWRADGIRCLLVNGKSPGSEVASFIFRPR